MTNTDYLMRILQSEGVIEAVGEYRFSPLRRWRFDIALPSYKIAVEIEGGIHVGGRHVRGKGYAEDCEKYRAAVLLGWRVLRYTAQDAKRYPLKIVADVKMLVLDKSTTVI